MFPSSSIIAFSVDSDSTSVSSTSVASPPSAPLASDPEVGGII
jgi:hypothetical protein